MTDPECNKNVFQLWKEGGEKLPFDLEPRDQRLPCRADRNWKVALWEGLGRVYPEWRGRSTATA